MEFKDHGHYLAYAQTSYGSTLRILSQELQILFVLCRATLISAWINNHMPNNVWDEITYPFNGEWIGNFIPHFI